MLLGNGYNLKVRASKKLALRPYEGGKWCRSGNGMTGDSPPPGIMVHGLKEEKHTTERAPREVVS